MRTSVHLPVIRRLRVINFPLYPGPTNQGIDLEFGDGVTVIAGINGIGKTTLLNLLMRMLLGASSPSKTATRDLGRVSKRTLVQARAFPYFSDRAADELGDDAVATLTFEIAGKTVVVTRSLKNLQIRRLTIARKSIDGLTNAGFLAQLAELAGAASAYDFHILVRYVQFFTEERLPLLWSSSSQFELFKMLFVDYRLSAKLNKLFADIQAVDSEYRNRTFQYNNRKDELEKSLAGVGSGASAPTAEDLLQAKEAQGHADREWKHALAFNQRIASKRKQLEEQLDEAQLALDAELHAFSHADATYISQALPTLDEKLQFLMQGLGSNLGCFVCGKRGKKELHAIGKKLRNNHCFVCDAHVAAEPSNVIPIAAPTIRKMERKIEALRATIAKHQDTLGALDKEIEPGIARLRTATVTRNAAARHLELLQAQVATELPQDLAAQLALEKTELDALDEKRKGLTDEYKVGVVRVTKAMDDFQAAIGQKLTHYAEAFLHEKVKVSFTRNSPFKLATGAGSVNIPTFRIAMTSSTHAAVRERGSATSVSESQKEFLDLAFRMTLLDILAGDGATMLVMETPEASLDSWFMKKAADLIRKFAPTKQGHGRMLLATSNVNGTTMIPALLGLFDTKGNRRVLPPTEQHRLINLMKIAAEPGVLEMDEAKGSLVAELEAYVHG
jgi:energy-coupling factor transporter ATP-binding protein EcfA2